MRQAPLVPFARTEVASLCYIPQTDTSGSKSAGAGGSIALVGLLCQPIIKDALPIRSRDGGTANDYQFRSVGLRALGRFRSSLGRNGQVITGLWYINYP